MATHSAPTVPLWPWSLFPGFTSTSYCFCGTTTQIQILEAFLIGGGTLIGGVIGWLAGKYGGRYLVKLLEVPGVVKLLPAFVVDFVEFVGKIPVATDIAGGILGLILGFAVSVAALSAAECPSCPAGRGCLCFCVLFFGPIPFLAYPCGSTCTATVPPGCP